MTTDAIVSATWLKEQLDAGRRDVRLLDVSWYSAKDAHEEYLQKHILGAAHFDIMKNVHHTDIFPRNLPAADDFGAYARYSGIDDDTHVVVYDTNLNNLSGFFAGARAWWMFKLHGHDKVSVLNGGLAEWENHGFPVTSDVPVLKAGNFKPRYNSSFKRSYGEMVENLTTPSFLVCDSRSHTAYKGSPEDPKTGHYPGAINISIAKDLIDPSSKLMKSPTQLRSAFETYGLNLEKPAASMCNSGMSSCTLALALFHAGAKDVGVFHGGFTEWRAKSEEGHIVQSQ